MLVFCQIQLRDTGRVHAFLDLDKTGVLQHQQCACQVAGVVGQRHAGAILDVVDALELLGVHAHRCDGALHDGAQH